MERMPASLPGLGVFEIRAFEDYPAEIAALTERGFTAQGRADLPPHPFALPFDWKADPFGDRNWMFQLQAWRLLDPHFNRLRHEPGHPRAFADICDVIADWHRDNIEGGRGKFTWYDMATGLRALRLAYLVLAARTQGVDLPDPALIAGLVDRHVAMLADPARLSPGNHGLFQLNGLMALVWLHPDLPRARRAKPYAVARMTGLLRAQLGPRAIHTEDAPYYHVFATKKIARIIAAPWWRIPEMKPARAKLARAEAACGWLVDPAGRGVPIGDSDASPLARPPLVLEKWPHARRGAHLGAALDGYGVVRSAAEVPPEAAALLFLTASFHAHGHKHSDCLSFLWQEGGADILIDSGKYGYERDAMRDYFVSRRAHNTVEIDGEDFARADAYPYGSGLRQVAPLEDAWLIEADADRRHAGVVHRRAVLYRPDRFVLAVDHVAGVEEGDLPAPARDLTAWWHFDPALGLAPEAGGAAWRAAGLPGGRILRIVHAGAAAARAHLHAGETDPRPQGWVSRAYLRHEPAPALGFSARAGAAYFAATLFEILPAETAPGLALAWRPADAALALTALDAPDGPSRRFAFGGFALEAAEALL